MYDLLRACYRFHCPSMGDEPAAAVSLSEFRRLERLPGASHPALYRIRFQCPCGDEHDGLVTHGELDYGPLAPAGQVFRNLLTGRNQPVADELLDLARSNVRRGNWPWTVFCATEQRMHPVFPSALALVAPCRGGDDAMGVAAICPGCGHVTVNLVSRPHLDVPFFHDPVVRYLDVGPAAERELTFERFREHLDAAEF